MYIKCMDDGSYVLTCVKAELSLIAEGLYAIEKTGKRCLANDVPDEFDRPQLEDEVAQLEVMHRDLNRALGEAVMFRIVEDD